MSVVERGSEEICYRYRPKRLSEVVGASNIIKALDKAMKAGPSRPKAYLFYGEHGCGKTTIARIMAIGLNCERGDTGEPCLECDNCKMALDNSALHIRELNLAQVGTKEETDSIVQEMGMRPLTGRNSCFIFDEAQMLTKAAQNLLLKKLEEPPPNTYIFICTTDPKKLIAPLVDRCEKHEFKSPTKADLSTLLRTVVENEKWQISPEDKNKFFEFVLGKSYREALKSLDLVMRGGIESLNTIGSDDPQMVEICRSINNGAWLSVVDVMNRMKADKGSIEPEAIRICVLRYFAAILKGKNAALHKKSAAIMEFFNEPFFEHEAEARLILQLYKASNVRS